MRTRIIIRADGGTGTGMGHIVRCMALAEMLKQDYSIAFAIRSTSPAVPEMISTVTTDIIELPDTDDPEQDLRNFAEQLSSGDLVILDGYQFKTDYQKGIRDKGCRLAVIDDLHAWHQVADVVINHAPGIDRNAYSAEEYTRFCLGLDYVLLRPAFLKRAVKKEIRAVRKAFISMGAADIHNNTGKFTEALLATKEIEEVHLMLSAVNPHLDKIMAYTDPRIRTHFNISAAELADLLLKCDLAICPASSISLECCAIGIGIISGYTAENQLGILNGLERKEVLISWKDLNQLSVPEISKKLTAVLEQPALLNEQLLHQQKLIDGRSPERFRSVFRALSSPLHFRFAAEEDADLYYRWANDEEVRKNSFQQDPIPYENHIKWFRSRVGNKAYAFYLFLDEHETPAGQVRIERTAGETVIGISIDKDFRGRSLGTDMLELACNDYLERFPEEIIHAYIKKENIASYRIFKKANFVEAREDGTSPAEIFKLCRRR